MDSFGFHPLVSQWFRKRFAAPTPPQNGGWPHIIAGEHTLIAAPTGSGKTLAAFLWAINGLIEEATNGTLEEKTQIVYVSPLKALGNDVQKNLQTPLSEIMAMASASGRALPEIRVAVRSGDTPAKERQGMLRRPPHILITTPESLYILLTAEGSRQFLHSSRTVIVDEIHAVAGDKRGSHLALSLERLDVLASRQLQRVGLSATQKPIEEIARLLVGSENVLPDGSVRCAIVDEGHRRNLDLSIAVPDRELGPIALNEIWAETYDRIASLGRNHRSTLVFVNTRRLVERVSYQLEERLGSGKVAAHHGSLSRPTRLRAEEGLKTGAIPVVIATASLELGIDIGHVDLVCHVGAPRSLASMLQRIGRSGHWLGGISKGILFPQTRDELMQCAAAVRAVRAGELDRVNLPQKPLDILAQQIVATLASGEMLEEEMWQLCRRAYPYLHLSRKEFDDLLHMLSEGISTRRGRGTALIHRDRVRGRLRARRGARLAAITGGGAIPDVADYDVIQEPSGTFVGKVNEDFAVESMAGDVFLLGNQSWRIRRIGSGKIRVEEAHGAAPNIPFWLGEAPARTPELSKAVSDLRERIAEMIEGPIAPSGNAKASPAADGITWLCEHCGLDRSGAEQLITYIRETSAVLGVVPAGRTVVAERFFDESGGMQLILHAPFGGRINRAWGLALRKRFCLTFDFELQAAATDDGLVLSLGEQHSFPLSSVASMVRSHSVKADLIQALLASPMFGNRWRWNATRALALLRFGGGRRVPMPIQRMRAEDLLAAVFPAQVACQDNHAGPIELPDHPLVNETIKDCLHEPMDLEGFTTLLQEIERGEIKIIPRDTPAPSPMSHEILNANPYAFLDDAPLEERRARAVSLRRIDPELTELGGRLDPLAVEEIRSQLWPDVRNPDELHDVLLSLVLLPVSESPSWDEFARELIQQGRVTCASWKSSEKKTQQAYVSIERVAWVTNLFKGVHWDPELHVLEWCCSEGKERDPEETIALLVQGWMDVLGPTTAAALADRLEITRSRIQAALLRLETQGQILRGQFASVSEEEWCERRILARIHRQTVGKLRREIEPVSSADYIRFLLNWQHLEPGTQLHGKQGILEIIQQLQGIEFPAPAWEQEILPRRIVQYDPADLESLCLSGLIGWGRLRIQGEELASEGEIQMEEDQRRPARRRQKPSRSAPLGFFLRENLHQFLDLSSGSSSDLFGLSAVARDVLVFLEHFGASFLQEITRRTGRLAAEVEDALWELVSRGLVTGDGVAGLRTLLLPPQKRRLPTQRFRVVKGGASPGRMMPVGRWSLLRRLLEATDVSPQSGSSARQQGLLSSSAPGGLAKAARETDGPSEVSPTAEALARQYLRRYGIVIREVLSRETLFPGWRNLLKIYWRMEARGEIRGGRFVDGFPGEQFALPLAIDAVRSLRRESLGARTVTLVSSADPLNLVGIITPGSKISPFANLTIAYQDGVPVGIGELGEVLSRLQGKMPSKGQR
ncbi:MAG TPA: DEAD/DEAH box helicase [Terriglobia bacterium]|nr:DEAD/DEAH box helicase [Terriglobia bacterium]